MPGARLRIACACCATIPECAREELAAQLDSQRSRPAACSSTFDRAGGHRRALSSARRRPQVAVLREQGVNSQVEMAAVLDLAGFEAHDIHMSDLLAGGRDRCGIPRPDRLRRIFLRRRARAPARAGPNPSCSIRAPATALRTFFARPDTFTLGVCNGCQMMAALKSLMPGTEHWPRFVRNRGEQFEGRFSLVEILRLARRAACGHGRFAIADCSCAWRGSRRIRRRCGPGTACRSGPGGIPLCRTARRGWRSTYPANPNGSPAGIAAVTSSDGRVLLTMPHPERSFRVAQNSWYPRDAGEFSGWMRMFRNARRFVG